MEGSSDSETGAAVLSATAQRLRDRALANAERARLLDQSKPSGQSPAAASAAGRAPAVASTLRRAKVPDLYGAAEWGKVRALAIREWTLAIDARCRRRTDAVPANFALLGHGLLILGPVGTGKSSAAALVCREAALKDRTLLWSYVPDLCDAVAQTAKDRAHFLRQQEGVDLLVWDDFGVRDLADWEIGYLDQIVEARYRARKPMVITSNWTADDLRGDPRLARMVDRWRERVCSNVAILTGESMRGQGD